METTNLAPIILFVYNRPSHTEQTLNALMENDLADRSTLYIYCDGLKKNSSETDVKNTNEVRKIIRKKQWCKDVLVVEREKNWGMTNNIIDGITTVIKRHGKIIELEDDTLVSKGFLQYMNDALNLFESDEKVMHINGYCPPIKTSDLPDISFYRHNFPWGWGTWERAWKHLNTDVEYLMDAIKDIYHFNMNGCNNDFYEQLRGNKNGSMDTYFIKWRTSVYLNKGLCFSPSSSLVNNIGLDGSGINSFANYKYYAHNNLANAVKVSRIPIEENNSFRKAIQQFYLKNQDAKYRLVHKIKRLIHAIYPPFFKAYERSKISVIFRRFFPH